MQAEVFKKLSAHGKETNVECFVVGGFVRDQFLERESKDFDILVIGNGLDFAKSFALKLNGNPKVSLFKNFGTAQVKWKDWEIEFVGARKESYSRDSRKPVVEDGSLDDDLARRDFTINALAIQLAPNPGLLIDQFDGLKHLEERRLQTPLEPDKTFSDDPLRMLRAVRFASQLDFEIAGRTLDSIRKNAERLKIISFERIRDEVNKIMLSKKPSIGFKLLLQCGLLQEFFPEMVALHGVKFKNGQGHKDNFYHTLKVLDNLAESSDDLWLRWAALLHDIAKPATQRFDINNGWTFHGHEDLGARWVLKIFKRFRLPSDHRMKYVQKLVRLHLRPISLTKEGVSDSAVRRLLFDAGEDIDDLLVLCKSDITSKNEFKVKRYRENFENLKVKLIEVETSDKLRNWQPPVTGEAIMEFFNIGPSKQVGQIKNAIREAILEGEISNNINEALILMEKKGKELGLSKA